MSGVVLGFLAAGLLSSPHCMLMCGPLLCGFCPPGKQSHRGTGQSFVTGQLPTVSYHIGRLWTYALLGLLAGWLGRRFLSPVLPWQQGLAALAGLALIGAAILVAAGGRAGALSKPLLKAVPRKWLARLAATRGPIPRLLAGVAMGFIPCGLVYAMLLPAAATGSPALSALSMGLFGLGTVPALNASRVLIGRARGPRFLAARLASPLVLGLAGCLLLWRALQSAQ